MIPLCDDPRRLAARLYVALRVDCGCCTFYRGGALGAACGLVAGGLLVAFAGSTFGAMAIGGALVGLLTGAALAATGD